MEPSEVDRLVLDSALEANILPITSRCASGCIFCSHKNNPADIAVASVGVRSLDEVARTLAFLDPGKVITIGESATTIIEGEPFSHPDFTEIVSLVRRAFPTTPLEITTNGGYLTADMVAFIEGVGNVALNVSLNSALLRGRWLLMGEGPERAERAIEGVRLLGGSSIPYNASIVALPNVVGWADVRDTVLFLASHNATSIRIVAPAFSSRADPRLLAETEHLYPELRRFVEQLPTDLPCPVLLEPSRVSDLTPVVSGVLKGSPAERAGLRRGDVFETIGGNRPRCRVEAWQWLLSPGPTAAEIRRGESTLEVGWSNPAEGQAGVTMEYDFDPVRMRKLGEAIATAPGRSLVMTSVLGYPVVSRVLELLGIDDDLATAVPVENTTFGGTIGAAGLLTLDDYVAEYQAWNEAPAGDTRVLSQIIIPEEGFDRRGFDLKRRHVSELEQVTGLPVSVR